MNKENVLKIARYFKSSKININSSYIMFNCPFARILHKHKIDKNPSFSISVSKGMSAFHCFSCGVKGSLKKLPFALSSIYKRQFNSLQFFINKYEDTAQILLPKENTIESIPESKLDMFPLISHNWKSISKEILQLYKVKEYNNQVIFPIYLHNLLVGLKFREDRKFMTVGKFKQLGAFYGMQFHINRKRPLYIVEGERDVMAMKQIGVTNIWGVSGTISKGQIEELKKVPTTIVLFLDNDDAGSIMFETIARNISPINDIMYVTNYFSCKDPTEIYEKGGVKLLRESLKSQKYWGAAINFYLTS